MFFAALSETRLLGQLLCLTLVRLVELGDEATEVLVDRRPLPPSLFGLVVSEFSDGPIGGPLGTVQQALGRPHSVPGEVLRRLKGSLNIIP